MCGIAGIIHLDGSLIDPAQLDRLTDALAHRGPDGRGVYIHGNVGLGHRRLSIIDLSDASSEPMISEDGNAVLTFNGEIYNFQEKRAMLEARGYRFRSTGDGEVLLNLYREFGEQCLDHLRGMFAFAIYDRGKGTVLLARDRVGKKPLKYFTDGRTFAFASEWKALRTFPHCPKGMDEEAVHHFLTMMYLPSPLTGISGIRKLPAAHSLTIDTRTGTIPPARRYWSLHYEIDPDPTEEEWKERILSLLQESVRLRMIADVPVGAFLSGGIDSATVVALMSQLSPYPVKTFSIGSPEETHNELPDAERIAKHCGTDHHPITLEADIVKLLPQLVSAYEEPFADPSSIPTFLVAQATRRYVTVALNGDGGDENFFGYVRYPILRFSERWHAAPEFVHAMVRPLTSLFHALTKTTLSYRMKRFEDSMDLPWEERYLQYVSFFTEEEKRSLEREGFGNAFPRTDSWYAVRTIDARKRAESLLDRAASMDIETYLADDLMSKVDLGSMAHALEARSPFLDHKFLELIATIPSHFKIRGRQRKWILKRLLQGMLPEETLQKRKTGFRLPLDRWFRTDLRAFVEGRLLDESSHLWSLFDRSKMEEFLESYFDSRIDFSDHVWALLWLDEWMRQFV